MKIQAWVLLAAMGCATARPVPTRAPLTMIEQVALPARPDAQPIAPSAQWVVPVETGQVAQRAGVMMSMENAQRAALWRIGYDELRGLYEVDRRTWVAQRAVYEQGLVAADREIVRLQPTWWDVHEGRIALMVGVFLGAGLAVGLAAALNGVSP